VTGQLNPKYSFDTFVVGAGSELAVTAAEAVAARPGEMYNPLYLYGTEGVGKTHLLMAVGQRVSRAVPPLSVEYATPDRMAEALGAAASAGQIDAFRHRLADVDVLLIDDAHLMDRRRDIQLELLRLIPAAKSAGNHLLFAGRCAPSTIENLDDRLVSLISGGLVVEMTSPDYQARLDLLRRRSTDRGAGLDERVLEAVAEFEITNVRELMTLLNRLIALDAVSESPLTPDAARSLLQGEALQIDTAPRRSVPKGPKLDQDEFADFLSKVSGTVEEQVTAWESNLHEAIERWGREGIDTSRLEGLLGQETPIPVDAAIQEFERDAGRLITLRDSVATVDPTLAEDPVLRDPDRVSEAQQMAENLVPQDYLPGPSPGWTFSSFISSERNRRTFEAVRAAAESASTQYNPLILVGRTGVGKTHLLHAAGNALTAALGSQVACFSAREFRELVTEAASDDKLSELRSVFARRPALLVDDIHLLVESSEAQDELSAIADMFILNGRQVVFTLNAPASEIEGLAHNLMSCIKSVSSFALLTPDRELRRAVSERLIIDSGMVPDPDLVDYLADRPADSVRAVMSLVKRVLEAADARGLEPTAALARELIEGSLPRLRRQSAGLRTSGVLVSPSNAAQSREKMIWSWPDPGERLIEELR